MPLSNKKNRKNARTIKAGANSCKDPIAIVPTSKMSSKKPEVLYVSKVFNERS